MSASVGQIALDIVMGKNTISSSIVNAFKDAKKVFDSNTSTIQDKAMAIGNTFTNVGASLLPVSTAIIGVGAACLNMATDFETSMAKVSTIADDTVVSLGNMEQAVLELSNKTGIAATDVANNVYDAISAGVDTANAVGFVENSTKLATAGFADSGAALDVLTTILNAYGLEATEVTKVSDLLINTQNLGKTTVGDLASSMGKVIPTANAMSVNLANLTSAYSIMTAKGIATAESTTYINSMLNELGNSGTTVGKIIKESTGKSFQQLMADGKSLGDVLGIVENYSKKSGKAFNELWGSAEAGKAGMSLLSDGVKGYNSRLKEMQDTTGSTEKAFEKMSATTQYKANLAMNQMKNSATDLGGVLLESLLPTINRVCDKIDDFTEWYKKLDKETKNTIIQVGAFVAALGPILIGVGKVITIGTKIFSVVSKVIKVVAKIGPILKGVVEVISLVAGGAGTLGEAIAAVFPVLGTIGSAIAGAFATIGGVLSSIGGAIASVVAAINPVVVAIVAAVAAVIAGIVLLIKNWDKVKEATINTFNTVKESVIDAFDKVKTTVVTVVTNIVNFITTNFSQTISNIKGVFDGLIGIFTNAWTVIKNIFLGAVLLIIDLVTGNFDKLKSDSQNILNNLKQAFSGILSGIKQVFVNVVGAIVSYTKTKFDLIRTTAVSIFNKLKSSLTTIVNYLKTAIPKAFNTMRTNAVNAFNNMKSSISKTATNIQKSIVNGLKSAINYIKSLPKSAVTWGKDFIDGLVKGIKSSMKKVTSAVNGVANKIRSVLHFSVPDEGPLTDYETWMPDFMEGLAKGINSNKSLVTSAINSLANEMLLTPQLTTPALAFTGGSSTNTLSSSEQNSMIEKLIEVNEKVLDKLDELSNMQVSLDGKKVVGELISDIDKKLGDKANKKRRGN